MKGPDIILSILLGALLPAGGCSTDPHILPEIVLMDKIKGGWAGQTIGCAYGGPTEFKYFGMIPPEVGLAWTGTEVGWYFTEAPGMYDDLYMDLTFLEVLHREGLDAPAASLAEAFARKEYPLWHANQAARRNILDGLLPPETGAWRNNPHADDIDFQIESDFIGLVSPGLPRSAAALCDRVGHIMNAGDGWYGGVYTATMVSLAFMEDDPAKVVRKAATAIPKGSRFRAAMDDVLDEWHHHPSDWTAAWERVTRSYGDDTGCPSGVLKPYDIDAVLNSAYVTIGLLYGGGDFGKSLEIATRCGQDSDCNPSTVGSILGVMLGWDALPDVWKQPVEPWWNQPFAYVGTSLEAACAMTLDLAKASVVAAGGRIRDDGALVFKPQSSAPQRLEQNFNGLHPTGRFPVSRPLAFLDSLSFEGEGIVVRYRFQQDGPAPDGYAASVQVALDGAAPATVLLPLDFNGRRLELFADYDLPEGDHLLRLDWVNPVEGLTLETDCYITYSR